jgi:hypothetical protein
LMWVLVKCSSNGVKSPILDFAGCGHGTSNKV